MMLRAHPAGETDGAAAVGFKQLPEPTDVLGCPGQGPGRTAGGYAGEMQSFSCLVFRAAGSSFSLSRNQALEEGSKHQIHFS